MKNSKKRAISIFMVVFMSLTFTGYYADVGVAYIDADGWYVVDFDSYHVGANYINESVSGDLWLEIEPNGTQNSGLGVQVKAGDDNYFLVKKTNSLTQLPYFINLSTDAIEISYFVTAGASSDRFRWHTDFLNGAGEVMFNITVLDIWNGGVDVDWYVYDENDAIIVSNDSLPADSDGSAWINLTVNSSTSQYHFYIDGGADVIIDYWDSVSNFDYVEEIYTHWHGVAGTLHYGWIDDFKVNTSSGGYLWSYNSPSFGSVTMTYESSVTYEFSTKTSWVLENEVEAWGRTAMIHQVAIALRDTSKIDSTACWLRIGDDYQATESNIYTWDNRYIIVWKNITTVVNEVDMSVEFLFSSVANDNQVVAFTVNEDVDNDGDIQRKYSSDQTYWNGVYDGQNTANSEYLIQVWYDNTGDSYSYGNVSQWTPKFDASGYLTFTSIGDRYVEWYNEYPSDDTIRAIDVFTTQYYYTQADGDLENFQLYVGKREYGTSGCEYIGTPDYWFPYTESVYCARWILDTPYDLDGGECNLELACQEKPVELITTTKDFNNDLKIKFFRHDYNLFWGNCWAGGETVLNREIVYNYHYEKAVYVEDNATDEVIIPKDSYTLWENIKASVTTKDPLYENTVRAYYDNGSGWTEFHRDTHTGAGFPKTVQGVKQFDVDSKLLEIGNWNITLWRNGQARAVAWFNVTWKKSDAEIWTEPNPSINSDTVGIFVWYNKTDTIPIKARVEISDGNFKDFYLSDDDKGNVTRVGTNQWYQEGIFSLDLIGTINGTTYYFANGVHVNQNEWIRPFLRIQKDALYGVLGSMDLVQLITYGHNSLNNPNIRVEINDGNYYSKYVGYDRQDTFSYSCVFNGTHTVSLVILGLDGSKYYLCENVTFQVHIIEDDDEDTQQKQHSRLLVFLFIFFLALLGGLFAGGLGFATALFGGLIIFSYDGFGLNVFGVEIMFISIVALGIIFIIYMFK